jgi:hypothetical protein
MNPVPEKALHFDLPNAALEHAWTRNEFINPAKFYIV